MRPKVYRDVAYPIIIDRFDSETQNLMNDLRQEKAQRERLAREKEIAIAEKFTVEQNLSVSILLLIHYALVLILRKLHTRDVIYLHILSSDGRTRDWRSS